MAARPAAASLGSHASPCRRRRRPPRRRGAALAVVVARRRRRRRAARAPSRSTATWRRGRAATTPAPPRLTDRPGAAAARAGDEPRGARRGGASARACSTAATTTRERRARAGQLGRAALRPLRLRRPRLPPCAGRRRLARALARHGGPPRARPPTRGSARASRRPRRGAILDRDGRALITERAGRRRRGAGRQGARPGGDGRRARRGARRRRRRARPADPQGGRRAASSPSSRCGAPEFARVEAQLADVPGVALNRTTAQLAPSRGVRARAARHRRAGDGGAGRAVRGPARARATSPASRGSSRRTTSGSPARPTRRIVIRYRETGAELTLARAPRRPAAGGRCARCSTSRCRPPPSRRSTPTTRPRSSPSSRRPATCSRSPTGPPTARTTARCSAATRRARRSRSSARRRCSPPGWIRRRRSTAPRRSRSRASRSATSRAARAGPSRSARTSRRAATPRSSRSPGGSTATR